MSPILSKNCKFTNCINFSVFFVDMHVYIYSLYLCILLVYILLFSTHPHHICTICEFSQSFGNIDLDSVKHDYSSKQTLYQGHPEAFISTAIQTLFCLWPLVWIRGRPFNSNWGGRVGLFETNKMSWWLVNKIQLFTINTWTKCTKT